jgi:hypothetical protein
MAQPDGPGLQGVKSWIHFTLFAGYVLPLREGNPPLQSAQLAELEATVLSSVRRAYELGRDEALKKLVETVTSSVRAPPLALPSPAQAVARGEPPLSAVADDRPAPLPWWSSPFR